MLAQVAKSAFIALGAGAVAQVALDALGSDFLRQFLSSNIVNLQIALLAVNSATMGIVLTKIRELMDRSRCSEAFPRTRVQMLLSIKEQVGLIVCSILLLSVYGVEKPLLEGNEFAFSMVLNAVFIYSMMILYDTAKSVLFIIDFKVPE